MTICSTQTELAVTVTCQCNSLQINLQLQSIKMHDAKLIRQAYCTRSVWMIQAMQHHPSEHCCQRCWDLLHTLSINMTCNCSQVKARGLADLILLAVPSGLQTNPLSLPDRHRKRQNGNTGPRSPAQTLLVFLSENRSLAGKSQKAWQNCVLDLT